MNSENHRNVFLILKGQGHRLTLNRKTLIELILSKKGHWTIQDLTAEIASLLPKVGVATIYRTVGLLHKNNLLSETRFGAGSARYEVSSHHHHDHLTCNTCGEVFEFENDQIERLQQQIARRLGFKLSDHRMELFGDCQRQPCKFKTKNRARTVTPRQKIAVKS